MSAKVSLISEAATRARRIDPRLVAQGWHIVDHDPAVPTAAYTRHAVRELPTASGPADYALFVDGRIVGIVEAKKTAGKRRILHAMATGTGKTFTSVNLVYRLLKSGVVRWVVFLVDRRVLAAQAVRAFAAFAPEASLKFDKIYEVYSQPFRRSDLDEEEETKVDLKRIPPSYLLDPDPAKPFVYVSTIQRIAINLFGKEAVFSSEDAAASSEEEDADRPPSRSTPST